MVKAPCLICGKSVGPKSPTQVQNGQLLGKPRRKHECPHGITCPNGSILKDGFNGAGVSKCPDCRSR